MNTRQGNSKAGPRGRRQGAKAAGKGGTYVIVLLAVLAAGAGGVAWYFGRPGPGPGGGGREGAPGAGKAAAGVREGQKDLGFVEPKSKHVVTFVVENPTGKPLELRRVRSGCACMTVARPPRTIAARGTAEVKVDFEAPKDPIDYAEKIVMETDSKERPVVALLVKARVGLPLEASPGVVKMGTLLAGEWFTGAVVLRNHGSQAVRPVYATAADTRCVAQVPRATIAPGGSLEIPVLVRVPPEAVGRQEGKMRIHTDLPRQAAVDVAAAYEVSTAYRLSRGNLDAGNLRPGETVAVELQVTATGAGAGEFVRRCTVTGVANGTVAVSVRYEGAKARVFSTVTGGAKEGAIRGRVVLELAGHDRPVEIGITGQVGGGASKGGSAGGPEASSSETAGGEVEADGGF